ncbi:MAG: hypothetical protein M1838_002919 [Thelocarpon superellum]|nr:MAG: hypothetical protein M1838_002919 [Thelocarpon superellum]
MLPLNAYTYASILSVVSVCLSLATAIHGPMAPASVRRPILGARANKLTHTKTNATSTPHILHDGNRAEVTCDKWLRLFEGKDHYEVVALDWPAEEGRCGGGLQDNMHGLGLWESNWQCRPLSHIPNNYDFVAAFDQNWKADVRLVTSAIRLASYNLVREIPCVYHEKWRTPGTRGHAWHNPAIVDALAGAQDKATAQANDSRPHSAEAVVDAMES